MAFQEDRVSLQTSTDQVLAQAKSFLQQLVESSDVNFGRVPFNIDRLVSDDYSKDYLSRIEFPTTTLPDAAVAPDAVSLDKVDASTPSVPAISLVSASNVVPVYFTDTPPTLNSITVPDALISGSFPEGMPDFTPPTYPSSPQVSIPSPPSFDSLAIPTAPSIDLPAFLGVVPTDDLLAPTAEFSFSEAAYDSTLLDPLKAKLLYDLTYGGYGIDTTDEVALFNRARDREVELALTRIEDAGRGMAARGFPLPPGELSIYIDRAWQDMQNKVSGVSRDITLERSKLFVENRQFTIREVKDVEQILIGFHNSVQERALNVARITVEMSIAVFNALVGRFAARLDSYKAQATVFAERIRGELVKAELYRAQIEAVSATAQVQRSQTETYVAGLKGIELAVAVFKTKMEAAQIQANVERTRLDAYRGQVDTYTARVQAKIAEFGLYRAQVEGNQAKVNVYDAQVRAFAGKAAQKKIEADINISNASAQAEYARAELAVYQAEVAHFDAEVRSKVEINRMKTDEYRANIDKYVADQRAFVGATEMLIAEAKGVADVNNQVYQQVINAAKVKLDAAVKGLEFRISQIRFGADKTFAQLTALMSSANTLSAQVETTQG